MSARPAGVAGTLETCPVCGAHVPADVALEICVAGERQRFCSARCADYAVTEAGEHEVRAELPPAPQRILVAVDGSGPSLRAVELAARLAQLGGGRIHLLHAVEPGWLRPLSVVSIGEDAVRLGLRPQEVGRALEADAQAQLARAERICREAEVPVTSEVAVRAPLDAVVGAAEEADLVVMGSRGLGAVATAFVGSLSQRVVARSRAPVLVVH